MSNDVHGIIVMRDQAAMQPPPIRARYDALEPMRLISFEFAVKIS
jgi:hypothetical protein